ncbi:MAG: HemK2/MTQ2 family protein methyltransferase [Promethearchaeota archaeon]
MDISKIKFDPVELETLPRADYFGLELVVPDQVYGPMEDTDLSMRFLRTWMLKWKKTATPENPVRILEIGCGSGILSLYLISRLFSMKCPFYHFGSDINPLAVQTANFNAQLNHLDTHTHFEPGEFFDALQTPTQQEPYDLIVFNPPYLADEPETINSQNRQLIDLAWEGGPNGNEVTLEFLKRLPQFLKLNSELMFISSSRVDQEPLLAALDSIGMKINDTLSQKVFFEKIFLYHAMKTV